jgi:hypothetical protein
MPRACAATPILPASSVLIAILKPAPAGPSMLALGTLQSSKIRLAVDDALMPSLSSFLPKLNPGVLFQIVILACNNVQ